MWSRCRLIRRKCSCWFSSILQVRKKKKKKKLNIFCLRFFADFFSSSVAFDSNELDLLEEEASALEAEAEKNLAESIIVFFNKESFVQLAITADVTVRWVVQNLATVLCGAYKKEPKKKERNQNPKKKGKAGKQGKRINCCFQFRFFLNESLGFWVFFMCVFLECGCFLFFFLVFWTTKMTKKKI